MGLFNWIKKSKKENDVNKEEQNIKELIEDEAENTDIIEIEAKEQIEEIQPIQNDNEKFIEVETKNNEEYKKVKEEIAKIEILEKTDNEQDKDVEDTEIDYLSMKKENEQISKEQTNEILNDICDERESHNDIEQEIINKTEYIEKPKGFFAKIKDGLNKTRKNILNSVEQVLKTFTKIDEELFEELEEALIMADIGVETSTAIIEKVKDIVKTKKISDVSEIKKIIVDVITEMLTSDNNKFELKSPSVILVIGVNGVGKTTTIGKLTNNFKKQNKKVILAAADTFRAAAIDQLEVWGQRAEVDVIKHQENSDPGAVVFDAIKAAKARKADILICDTAGRLHNKKNLMEELKKIFKIVSREYSEAQLEVLLVLDSTTGQNALQQAKLFKEVADITGIILTKLDGTAKGGIIIAIKNELQIPVRFIGVGEGIDDLQPFDAEQFAKALFDEEI